ncbi:MAG TPA: peptidylprolyl isomerase, partial [Gemmatimonadaceae bacterium]|nr:peptidylprolyl isomerase [Gemmatimonadaceae bacterium]
QMRSAAKYIWLFIIIAFVGGFLLVDSSGLIGSSQITPTTAVAEVNGRDLLYSDWQQRVSQTLQNQQQTGRALTQDEVRQIENQTLDEMIMQVLLQQEYRRRGITVTDDELREFARYAPPPFMYNAPELHTEGQFDPVKYQRLLASPQARQQGILLALESYYRSEIPREKLFEQIADGVYITDADLWRSYRDEHDTAQVSYVSWTARPDPAVAGAIPASEVRAYFEANTSRYERPGQAWLSVLHIPRVVGPADSAATRAQLLALREEIRTGSSFEDVARRESVDTVSGADGGDLGRGVRGRFVPEFEDAAFRLRPGVLSEPVLTAFGYHLIRVDERKGDTIALRHILLRPHQSDSAATATDRQADELARIAAGLEDGTRFDTAAIQLQLPASRTEVIENQPAMLNGVIVPSVGAWAFGGVRPGEISELFDDENGYWIARLDSIVPGGTLPLARAEAEIRQALALERSLDQLMSVADLVARGAAATGLESAAAAGNLTVSRSPAFTRTSFVPGLGQYSMAMGAAFGLPVGAVSAPIRDETAVHVVRVDRRVSASRAAYESQRDAFRQQRLQQLRQQRVQLFLSDLRRTAKIEDHRVKINAAIRRLTT